MHHRHWLILLIKNTTSGFYKIISKFQASKGGFETKAYAHVALPQSQTGTEKLNN